MEGTCLKEKIQELIAEYVEKYQAEKLPVKIWRTPIVGYADAKDPYFKALKNVVVEAHKVPEDFMENPNIVISYFIPFTKELERTNVGVKDNLASNEWSKAYNDTNTMMGELNHYLVEELNALGYRAAVPEGVRMLTDVVKSNWSQRHVAYAAGLGTFGINNLLISSEGSCGRYNSIVADIPVEADKPLEQENCLYKAKGICKKCVENCFSGALTVDGFDRFKCFEICTMNMEISNADVCGKCATDIPCAFCIPGK